MQSSSTSMGERSDRDARLAELRAMLGNCPQPQPQPEGTPSTWETVTGEVGPGRLVDCLAGTRGSGAGLVALWLCQQVCSKQGELVVIDMTGDFYPPAAVAWGVDTSRLLIVTPANHADALVATEISLRSPAVGAVWSVLGAVDGKAFRRLLLSAEEGNTFGALMRPAKYQPDPSWANVQLRFDPVPSPGDPEQPLHVRVTQTRNRHGLAGAQVTLAIDWKSGRIAPTR